MAGRVAFVERPNPAPPRVRPGRAGFTPIRSRWSLGIVLCLLILLGRGLGEVFQDSDLTSLSIEELSQVRLYSASRHLEDPRKAPSAVTVITADEITHHGWRTIGEVLRSVRGFYIASDRDYTYIGVRGFLQSGDYNARVLLLIDGHRVNENVYDSALIGSEFPLDLQLVDRIEIVRGPSSSLYGTNAVLAVVNVITRRPIEPATLEVSGSETSFLGREGRITGLFRNGGLSGVVSGSLFASHGASRLYFPEFDTPETNNGFAIDIDGERYAHTFADLEYANFRVQGLYSTRYKVVPTASYSTNFNDPANRSTDNRGYFDVSYHRGIGASSDLDLRGYYDAYRFFGTYPYGGTNSPDRYVQVNDARADWIGFEGTVAHKFGRHRIVAGALSEHNLRIRQINYNVGEPPFLDETTTPSLVATYSEAELNLTPKFTINAGGRMDWYSNFGAAFSPRIALMYLPTHRTSLKYIYGQAFRAPDAYDQFFVDNLDETPPNRNLLPEKMIAHTLVWEHRPRTWLGVTIDAFYNNLNRVIEQEFDPVEQITHFANGKGDHGRGVEIELDAKRESGWAARTSYTFSATSSDTTDRVTPNSPAHMAKLNGTMPVTRRAFFGVELLYTGTQQNYAGITTPSSFLTNVTFSTKPLRGGWKLSASCYDLFDRAWYTPTGPDLTPVAVRQDGRTFRFAISKTFSILPERSKK